MSDLPEIAQCPSTGKPLHWNKDGQLAAEGGPSYTVIDGIAGLLPRGEGDGLGAAVNDEVREFYDTKGWVEDEQGLFAETKATSDTRSIGRDFTNRCIARVGKYFSKGGKYLLDAGCGPIPYQELMRYGDRFEKRVCVDISVKGLWAARQKLGERGLYLQGDLANLPLKTGSMDAITCNHVIYQLPPEHQAAAWLELWRVLKPGGMAVVVYFSSKPRLAWKLEAVSKVLFGDLAVKNEGGSVSEELPHHPMPLSWFEGCEWPFSYKLDSFRPIGQSFLRDRVPGDWRGHIFLEAIYALQSIAPGFCGKYGSVPAFVIRKPA